MEATPKAPRITRPPQEVHATPDKQLLQAPQHLQTPKPMQPLTHSVTRPPRPMGDVGMEHFSVPSVLPGALASMGPRAEGESGFLNSSSRVTMLPNAKGTQEVVLFAIHPHAIVSPLRNRVNQKMHQLQEWVIHELQKRNLYPTQAIVRLQKQRWYMRLFDMRSIGSMINIFYHYLCQADVLIVPQSFRPVYEAYSLEMNRTVSGEAFKHNDSRGAACVVGGIDFTEETVLSTQRVPQQQQTPVFTSARFNIPTPIGLGNSSVSASANSAAIVNRQSIINQEHLATIAALLPRLTTEAQEVKQRLEETRQELKIKQERVQEKQRQLLFACYSLAHQKLSSQTQHLESILRQLHDAQTNARLSKALDHISQQVDVIKNFTSATTGTP
ncbi:hypothetical protein BdWA1_000563 [Babesia duncani]|uniref:Uncharacterized protein n=1 Tax=Babesia duncani TaxID=323732 RepID=A0AAD9PGY0_9APIC|nr:hypothetical protein BdWA1_003877 [Babesia duncani]KAK2197561.1 hypothetical protein BdWA1_000563 [Babesia duncani]